MEHILYRKLNKNFFSKVFNRKTIKEPINSIYDDEIMFKVVLYK